MIRRSAVVLSVLLISLCYGCGGGVIQRVDQKSGLPPPPPRKGFLQLPQGPSVTKIYLDGRYIGRYKDYPRSAILLPIGLHRLKLTAKDYANLYIEVDISSDQTTIIKGKLIHAPPHR